MDVERYERQKLLGQGLMSAVWLARDTYTQEFVALKIMTAIPEDDRRNQKARERFHREIEIASSLQHPHVLPIISYGYMRYDNRNVPYLVSPYISEGSLADLIKARPPWQYWSLLQTADAVMQAAESLYYLHTRTPQIVHQDVKPGNFLLRSVQSSRRAVHLYLCDFGISRWRQSSATMASELVGTFAFMAPEQVERKVDCASDQYALAVMACYLLTGKLPIQAATNEQYAEAHLHELPLAPSQLNPDRINSPQIDDVILRALEKIPTERFPTIVEFAQALQQAIMRLAQARAAAPTERLGVAARSVTSTQERPSPPAQPAPVETEQPIALDPLDTNEGRILDEPLPAKPEKVVAARGVETSFALLPFNATARRDLPARPKLLWWSPDGDALACALYGSVPLILGRKGLVQEIRAVNAEHTACLCWSPDGRAIAVSLPGEICFWDVAAQTLLPLVLRFNVRTIEGMDWSAGGQLAVWVDHQILLYTLSYAQLTGSQAPEPQTLATGAMRCANVGVLRWSPDGARLAAGAGNGAVLCWNVGSRAAAWQVASPGQKVNSLVWSHESDLLAVAFRDNRVIGWDVYTRDMVCVWENLPAMPRTLSISTGRRIVLASGEPRLLSGYPNELFPSAMLTGQLLAAWSPTRTELATLDERRENALVIWHE